ncbi:MAG: hypothetical protein MJE68_31180 [Proteobacteria bacterium]|nr:hypothetical protein [Pseudomonadota bacterium]
MNFPGTAGKKAETVKDCTEMKTDSVKNPNGTDKGNQKANSMNNGKELKLETVKNVGDAEKISTDGHTK